MLFRVTLGACRQSYIPKGLWNNPEWHHQPHQNTTIARHFLVACKFSGLRTACNLNCAINMMRDYGLIHNVLYQSRPQRYSLSSCYSFLFSWKLSTVWHGAIIWANVDHLPLFVIYIYCHPMMHRISTQNRSPKILWHRDNFVYVPSLWEATLQCNVISHWLGTNTKWSLWHYEIWRWMLSQAWGIAWLFSNGTLM